ncbi:MAG: hypothetical protein AAB486_04175 [Patescibacteria group bacterium]
MRCLIIRSTQFIPEAKELALGSLGNLITDWIEIPPATGVVEKYLRQADFVFVGGTAGISLREIGDLVENSRLPVIIVTSADEFLLKVVRDHNNVVLVPSLTVVNSESNRLSERIRSAYYSAGRMTTPYAIAFEDNPTAQALLPARNLVGPIKLWFEMGWRIGRLIVWGNLVLEITQDFIVPCGDCGSYNHRVLVCRPSNEAALPRGQKNPHLIEVFEEKWEL